MGDVSEYKKLDQNPKPEEPDKEPSKTSKVSTVVAASILTVILAAWIWISIGFFVLPLSPSTHILLFLMVAISGISIIYKKVFKITDSLFEKVIITSIFVWLIVATAAADTGILPTREVSVSKGFYASSPEDEPTLKSIWAFLLFLVVTVLVYSLYALAAKNQKHAPEARNDDVE